MSLVSWNAAVTIVNTTLINTAVAALTATTTVPMDIPVSSRSPKICFLG